MKAYGSIFTIINLTAKINLDAILSQPIILMMQVYYKALCQGHSVSGVYQQYAI